MVIAPLHAATVSVSPSPPCPPHTMGLTASTPVSTGEAAPPPAVPLVVTPLPLVDDQRTDGQVNRTSEQVNHTSEQINHTSEQVNHTSEQVNYTSEQFQLLQTGPDDVLCASDSPDSVVDPAALSEDLTPRIISQVEHYFSDERLVSDKYMLSLIKKNKEGYVPITNIISFKRMKKITQDFSVVATALKESSFLAVSSDGQMVKRVHPYLFDEVADPQLCTVIVENLPVNHSAENMKVIFGEAGRITNISFCDPQSKESKKGIKKNYPASIKLHALVEYDTPEAAEKAVSTLNDDRDWRNGMRVKLLKTVAKPCWRREPKLYDATAHVDQKKVDVDPGSPSDQSDIRTEEDSQLMHREKNEQHAHNRCSARRKKYVSGAGHVLEPSKPPPGPKMPDGTRGFSMGRGRPLP